MDILVVEDEPYVREPLETVLKLNGYSVAAVENGARALREVQEHPPQLVLLDLWMPVMNGWDFLTRLRDLPDPLRRIPVIVLSADSSDSTRYLPAEVFMTKPVSLEILLEAVKDQLETREREVRGQEGA